MNVDLARLNHILIPATKEGRDRLRAGPLGRLLWPVGRLYEATTPEGQVLALLAGAAGVLGLDAARTQAHLVFALLAAILVGSLAVSLRFGIRGGALAVSVPRRVAVGDEATFTITVTHRGAAPARGVRVRGPFLPYDGRWTGGSTHLGDVAPGAAGRAELRARFARRGEHHLDAFAAGALVPFGLAVGPLVRSAGVRFVVVPRIARVERLRLPLGRRLQPGGVALASRTGDALELLGVRPYHPGDPVRDLHARTWARTGFPAVRERQQEFFSRVCVVLDPDVAGATPRALEAALSLAAGVVAHLARGEALIDLVVAGEPAREVTLGRSLAHVDQALELLACVQAGPPLAPADLLARLAPRLPRLSSVVLVTLAWDGARREVVQRVRAAGVGCRALWVGGAAADADAAPVPVEAIERQEALAP